jgi:hypothetical protein
MPGVDDTYIPWSHRARIYERTAYIPVPTPHRTPCPLRTILLANGALFAFGILGWLAYLLR